MQGSFDQWTSLFLLVSGTGIFLFIILMTTSQTKKSNFPIALIVLLFSLTIFQYVLFWTNHQKSFLYTSSAPALTYLSVGPLLYIYFLSIFKISKNRKQFFHFLPALGILLPELLVWFYYSTGTMLFGEAGDWIFKLRKPLFNPYLQIGHMCIYAIILWRMIYQRKKSSNLETHQVTIKWTTILARLNTLFILALLSYYILVQFPFFNKQWDYMICMTMSFSIYAIGFMAFKQPAIFNGELFKPLFLPKKIDQTPLPNSTINVFYKTLITHLENEKPYLDSELRLTSLADQVSFSSHLLSQIINKKSGKNFNQFINDFRLKEAERLLIGHQKLNIKEIYFQVGFNNKATFYQVFKSKHKVTPSTFRKTHLSK